MTTSAGPVQAPAPDVTSAPSVLGSAGMMLFSSTSNQVGAALGAHAFPIIGPVGVVSVRQLVAASVLLPIARPPFRRMTWPQWWPVLLLALVFATMNVSLYVAIGRLGLGLAITLEFLGPLSVALLGSRGRRDLLLALAAGVGVYVLVLPGPSSDWLGIGLALLAATCWASYILLQRVIGARLPGLQAPAAATSISALVYLPVFVGLCLSGRMTPAALGYSIAAGVGASVIPYAVDLIALRRVTTRFFGVFMSVNPVLAALAGLVILGQVLALHEWLGILIVVTTNAIVVLLARAESLDRPVDTESAGLLA